VRAHLKNDPCALKTAPMIRTKQRGASARTQAARRRSSRRFLPGNGLGSARPANVRRISRPRWRFVHTASSAMAAFRTPSPGCFRAAEPRRDAPGASRRCDRRGEVRHPEVIIRRETSLVTGSSARDLMLPATSTLGSARRAGAPRTGLDPLRQRDHLLVSARERCDSCQGGRRRSERTHMPIGRPHSIDVSSRARRHALSGAR